MLLGIEEGEWKFWLFLALMHMGSSRNVIVNARKPERFLNRVGRKSLFPFALLQNYHDIFHSVIRVTRDLSDRILLLSQALIEQCRSDFCSCLFSANNRCPISFKLEKEKTIGFQNS